MLLKRFLFFMVTQKRTTIDVIRLMFILPFYNICINIFILFKLYNMGMRNFGFFFSINVNQNILTTTKLLKL